MPSAFRQPTALSAASTRSSKPESRAPIRGRFKGGPIGSGQDGKSQDDGTKSDVPSNHLTEVDREWYNIRIRDLEEKLSRALDEREKFEKEATLAGEELEKLKTDDQDVIKYLQRTLQSRDDHCRELTERLKGMQLAREKECADYERQLEGCRRSFDVQDQKSQSEIKLLQGKLTSLEEFRIQKDTFEAQIKEAKEHLEQKERELPEQLERMERATVLRIEAMKEEHAKRIGELSAEMEEQAFVKLGESAKRALEENTLLLRQVAAVGGRLTTVEGQLANARYQNQGLKTLLNKMEAKYNEAVKQCNAEKNRRKNFADLDEVLKQKIIECERLEKLVAELQTETASSTKRVHQLEQDRVKHLETINEQANANDKMRESLSKHKKKAEILAQAVQTAKNIMAQVLEADGGETLMIQVMEYINEDFAL